MIAVVGRRDLRIGFGLAGVKKAYSGAKSLRGEKIVILETSQSEQPFPAGGEEMLVKVSLEENVCGIEKKFIRQVMGANVLLK